MWVRGQKGSGGRGLQKTEETLMKLITHYELATLTPAELHQLHRHLSQSLAGTAPGSAERRNCLASLENIRQAVSARRHFTPGPGL